jgi:hypothetical protein
MGVRVLHTSRNEGDQSSIADDALLVSYSLEIEEAYTDRSSRKRIGWRGRWSGTKSSENFGGGQAGARHQDRGTLTPPSSSTPTPPCHKSDHQTYINLLYSSSFTSNKRIDFFLLLLGSVVVVVLACHNGCFLDLNRHWLVDHSALVQLTRK